MVILPSILALGEPHSSGRDVLTAYVLGVEGAAIIASISGLMPGHYERGWHPMATIGILGATAASAKISNLDIEQTKNAFGIAASEASGLRANFGTIVKPFHAGSAAKKGVIASLLAKSGFVANQEILESPFGYLSLFSGKEDLDIRKATENNGKSFDIIYPGISIKKYPCCFYAHLSIDALLYLVKEHQISAQDVKHICCGLSEIATNILIHSDPKSGLEAKFSLPYCIAVALLNKDVKIDDFQNEKIYDGNIRQTMKKIEIYSHSEKKDKKTRLNAIVDIETKNGHRVSLRLERPAGHSLSPLPWEDIVSKFRKCSSMVLEEISLKFVIKSVKDLESLSRIKKVAEVLTKKSRVTL